MDGGLLGKPFCPPNCLKNCWMPGGRLLNSPFQLLVWASLTFTETTAGLTRSINGANEGMG